MNNKFFHELSQARLASNPWSSSYASGFKKWIKKRTLDKQGHYCCYCQRDLLKETDRNKHIEHILPKSKFPLFIFDPSNLAISCVRCNSDQKSDDVTFLTVNLDKYKHRWSNKVYNSNLYKFIHPNLDSIQEHLIRELHPFNNRVYYQYKWLSEKGLFHYNYFDLRFFESEDISKNQGIIKENTTSNSRQLVDDLFKKYSNYIK